MKKRTDEEMTEMILHEAREDERVLAVWMNGSRANPNAPKDGYQDFDVVFAVRDWEWFIAHPEWVDRFGERVIMQTAYNPDFFDDDYKEAGCYNYMMQFLDGNRIDLTFVPVERAVTAYQEDRMVLPLLDKEGILPEAKSSTDEDYWIKPPDAKHYKGCCNEFWWVACYVAKGVWRRELPYAQEVLNHYTREALMKMLDWRVGVEHGFSLNTGKCGKWLSRYLSAEEWSLLEKTYAGSDYGEIIVALNAMTELFRLAAKRVGNHFGFSYNQEDDQRVIEFINR